MVAHRSPAEKEPFRDFPIRLAPGDVMKNLGFARGQDALPRQDGMSRLFQIKRSG